MYSHAIMLLPLLSRLSARRMFQVLPSVSSKPDITAARPSVSHPSIKMNIYSVSISHFPRHMLPRNNTAEDCIVTTPLLSNRIRSLRCLTFDAATEVFQHGLSTTVVGEQDDVAHKKSSLRRTRTFCGAPSISIVVNKRHAARVRVGSKLLFAVT